ncbi:MAG: AAA family ATPase [Leptospiraceae bacterium]|nr:AAA family ATPase [Leptospiraceae bacterium]MCP5494987.1 AAA family ATPase [Leptospiraceae bacterium]
MLKKLTINDLSVSLKDEDFEVTAQKLKNSHPEYFLFQDKALEHIRVAIDNPSFYKHFVIVGPNGSGKKDGIIQLLNKEYKTPVIYEPFPNVTGLIGLPNKNEYYPGRIVQARGGFLILPLEQLIKDTYCYDILKSCLLLEKIQFGYLPELLFYQNFDRTYPDIPIDLRVILVGEEYHFEHLYRKDMDLIDVFKMKIELEDEVNLNKNNITKFSILVDTFPKTGYPKANKKAKKRLLEESLRINESQLKFTSNIAYIQSIFSEVAVRSKNKKILSEKEVEIGIQSKEYRNSISKRKYYEELKNGLYNIILTGSRLGRINALSIMTDYSNNQEYGQLSIISSRAMMGTGSFINIEREVNLSGDIHDKGIFILQSYLKGLFSNLNTFGLDASIMFEQSYSPVDGDSASVAELLAILSALSGLEIPSNIAITGSMTQYGEILPIGSINQKIEAWHSIIKVLGKPSSTYKMFMPASNINNLLLSHDVIQSVKDEKLLIYSSTHVSEIIPLILDIPMGKIEKDGKYSKNSLLRMIEDRVESKKELEKEE